MMEEQLTKAKYSEFQASLFGACLIAFGLGVLLADYFQEAVPVVILAGIALHGWGMYRMRKRNK